MRLVWFISLIQIVVIFMLATNLNLALGRHLWRCLQEEAVEVGEVEEVVELLLGVQEQGRAQVVEVEEGAVEEEVGH